MFYALIATFIPWCVYYADQAPIESFKPFDLVVLDRFEHPPIRPLLNQGKKVFGYVTLGEVDSFEPWYSDVKKDGLILQRNEDWPESEMVDLRNPKWAKRVIEQVIPFVLHQGFNGLFLDTIDNAAFLEEQDPKFKGMKEAAIALVKAIKLNYPAIPLMLNRGLDIGKEVAFSIDYLVGENAFSSYDKEKKSYHRVPLKESQELIKEMKEVQKINPKVTLLSLDYADPNNKSEIKKIYQLSKAAGLSPYVSTIDLDVIISPP